MKTSFTARSVCFRPFCPGLLPFLFYRVVNAVIARDMAKYNTTYNAIRPTAATRLTLNPDLIANWERAGLTNIKERVEANQPDDISLFIIFLCTEAASHISGRTFSVAGGEISLYSEPGLERTIYKKGRWTVEELLDVAPNTLGQGLKVTGIT
jgi:hypothetical protein